MRTRFAMLGVLCLMGAALSQENYSTWSKYKDITINTTSGGANVTGTVAAFPVLVRLTPANADVFSQALSGGADIRFANAGGAHLPYQIERFDTANKVAEIWVLVDTVKASDSTKIRIYWGKSGAADSSSGPRVFSPENGFEAVYHMSETGLAVNGTSSDATDKGHTATALVYGTGAIPPGDATDGIGVGKTFNGNNAAGTGARGGIGGYFVLADSGVEGTGLSLNTKNGPWTVSAWVKPTACTFATNSATSGRYAIVGKYNGSAGNKQWILQANNVANQWKANIIPSNLNAGATGSEMSSITNDGCTAGAWQFLTMSYSSPTDPVLNTPPTSAVFSLTHNTVAGAAPVAGTNQYGTTARVTIGATDDSTRMMNGSIDEVVISKVQRSADWIKLSYATQMPGATVVVLGVSVSNVPGSPSIISNPASKTVVAGSTVKFGVVASGNAILVYKWVRRNIDTVGTNSDSLTLTNVSNADTGSYKCVVRNSLGQVVSASANLTLIIAPTITSQPVNSPLVSAPNIIVKFGVKANGTAPLSYQWIRRKGSIVDTLTNTGIFTLVTTDSLTVTNSKSPDSGSTFKCLVTNAAGFAVSDSAVLRVFTYAGGVFPGKGINSFAIQTLGSLVKFHLPDGISSARVSVMDIWGRSVWSKTVSAGVKTVSWEGSYSGPVAAPGVYLVRLTVMDANHQSKLAAESKILITP